MPVNYVYGNNGPDSFQDPPTSLPFVDEGIDMSFDNQDIIDNDPLNILPDPSTFYDSNGAFSVEAFLNGTMSAEEKALLTQIFELFRQEIAAYMEYANKFPTSTGGSSDRPVPTKSGRPPGDHRSAEEIINSSPVAKNLGNQKDIKREELKKQVGDWTSDNPDPEARADAAYNLVQVLEYIDSSLSADGRDRGEEANNGDITGITKDGDARHGTEAGLLKDFAEQGYSIFDGSHCLQTTNDSHVRWDGSNKDNFQWFVGEVGKALDFLPGLGNVLQAMGESKGGVGGMFLAGLDGIAKTIEGGLGGLLNGLLSGNMDPISLMSDIYEGSRTAV
jgi:hypothetical protein